MTNGKSPTAKGTAAAKKAWQTIRAKQQAELPPHDDDCEEGALSCVLQAGDAGSQQNVEATMMQMRGAYFYDHRRRVLHDEIGRLLMAGHKLDSVFLRSWLKQQKVEGQLFNKLEEVGGDPYIRHLLEVSPSPANFGYYLPKLKEFYWRRWCLGLSSKTVELANDGTVSGDAMHERMQSLFGEAFEKSSTISGGNAPLIKVVSPAQARAYEPDPTDFLLGEGLISRGMFVTIGGEPGVGKSRLATTLAIAGARGKNFWLRYPIRTKWRTLVLQSENDANRLKEDAEAIPQSLNDDIRFTDGLAHGMAFDRPEFRRELRRIFDDWPFEMLVIDPWNDVTSEDGQKDYKQALLNIAACFRGVKMPAVVIVAHLRKRGRDDNGKQRRKTGTDLLHELSGSLALGSTSRTVFVVQSVTSDAGDGRVVVEVVKKNNVKDEWIRQYGARSACRRANGAFEELKDFDWADYDNPGDPERRTIEEEDLRAVFVGEKELKPARLAKKLKEATGVGESTAFRAIGPKGYLAPLLARNPLGHLYLKEANGH